MSKATFMFLERTFDPPLTVDDVLTGSRKTAWCFELHNVTWHGSFLGAGGRKMLCWFSAIDAESTRMALRKAQADARVLWAGTVHDGSESAEPNVLVERRFETPVELKDIQAIEDAGASCLQTHRVRFARTFFANDRKRMLCLYQAPDAEAVRVAQREAGMPVEAVWAFQRVGPEVPSSNI